MGRKKYEREVLADTRAQLSQHATAQQAEIHSHNFAQYCARLEKLAGTRHHLLGTKAIPGVFSGRVPDLGNSARLDSGWEEQDENEGRIPDGKDGSGVLLEEPPPLPRPTHLGPLIKVPESKLRDNAALKDWIRQTVGKNPKHIIVKPPPRDEEEVEEGKLVQGPFLPLGDLNKKKHKQLRPSLRVQTDYLSVLNAWREERLREMSMRITTEPFQIPRHIPHEQPYGFQHGDPYKLIAYGRKTFREEDPNARISRFDFKNIVPPVDVFEDLAADVPVPTHVTPERTSLLTLPVELQDQIFDQFFFIAHPKDLLTSRQVCKAFNSRTKADVISRYLKNVQLNLEFCVDLNLEDDCGEYPMVIRSDIVPKLERCWRNRTTKEERCKILRRLTAESGELDEIEKKARAAGKDDDVAIDSYIDSLSIACGEILNDDYWHMPTEDGWEAIWGKWLSIRRFNVSLQSIFKLLLRGRVKKDQSDAQMRKDLERRKIEEKARKERDEAQKKAWEESMKRYKEQEAERKAKQEAEAKARKAKQEAEAMARKEKQETDAKARKERAERAETNERDYPKPSEYPYDTLPGAHPLVANYLGCRNLSKQLYWASTSKIYARNVGHIQSVKAMMRAAHNKHRLQPPPEINLECLPADAAEAKALLDRQRVGFITSVLLNAKDGEGGKMGEGEGDVTVKLENGGAGSSSKAPVKVEGAERRDERWGSESGRRPENRRGDGNRRVDEYGRDSDWYRDSYNGYRSSRRDRYSRDRSRSRSPAERYSSGRDRSRDRYGGSSSRDWYGDDGYRSRDRSRSRDRYERRDHERSRDRGYRRR
ncbi:spermatogenesis-associated protein 17 [Rhizophlyctis rosea]|nr:spermatogenesis-associated protein 17 [Rhizophlyctis rosea]